ncbi:MAG: O-antigen ligase family protein [Chloroflexota bacterium]|nr:O-antigen ligase family protein [Chloroflexota bacterium]
MSGVRIVQVNLRGLLVWGVATVLLTLAIVLGMQPSIVWLALLGGGLGAAALLQRPALGLPLLVLAALVVPLEIGTGTQVVLNPAALLVPALLGLWLFRMAVVERNIAWVPSPVNRPLLLFLVASLVSFAVGRLTWDPFVPVSANFWLVQMAQWSIFAFSAGAFWLTANQVRSEAQLRQLTLLFLLVAGSVAILRMVPGLGGPINRVTTIAFIRAPLWMLLSALAGGQLLFNHGLARPWRVFLWAVLVAVVYYAFVEQQEAASNWVGIAAVAGVLFWLRYPRWRVPIVVLALALIAAGILFPAVYEFAGGDDEWILSGGSRLVLIGRVVEVTLRNPVTGLGPAAYRPYANMKPLPYMGAYWVDPLINSHNNYVDLFAHGGALGLALFAWFAWEVYRLGLRLYRRYQEGFTAGYVNGMLAAGAGSLVIMLLADWILPFVYNIGFPGFQASVLVWLFLGGLVAIETFDKQAAGSGNDV